ncbi:FAD-dependent oxidoreductase [Campylobacter hepaticus]|uniref:NAD(P)/FAD-dependent oxidoreductase n=1 Tax=Campylobacter hepaticus TaxID=1813019 RepID=UPI0018CA53BE|nr:FAD-dependent oxidoreductase [Campylobacter hepaticus]QPM44671.1 FAD-dependent oxidoreductase [Campylobacter hepaticus]
MIAKNGNYTYDILIIGLGFNRDDFKISGVEEHTLAMQNFNNCLDIHKKLQEISLKDKCEVIVCGAGFSGIELLADLALHFKNIKLKCVEAMPMILPMFNKNLAQFAKQYLEKLGVEFYLNAKIEKYEKNSLIFEKNGQKEKIEADLILYTAGVKGNKVIENSSFF